MLITIKVIDRNQKFSPITHSFCYLMLAVSNSVHTERVNFEFRPTEPPQLAASEHE